jgi:histidyl-tRNA synthetase
VRDALRETFERYGYQPLETPAIEREDLMALKGGGEIQKEIFRLTDQGDRALALRFDQTLPLARVYATNKDLRVPFKRYAIGEVFRDGPTQPEQGRYRIFTQCDVDVIGVPGPAAEAELFQLAADAFAALGLGPVRVRVNNRKVLNGVLDAAGIHEGWSTPVILILDKLDKIGREGVAAELAALPGADLDAARIERLLEHISLPGENAARLAALDDVVSSEGGRAGLAEMRDLLALCEEVGVTFVEFDPSLARGLDYYTGTTLEVFLGRTDLVSSAITAGGRYDAMMGDFRGSDEPHPAVGISFGLERVCMALEEAASTLPETTTELFIIPLRTLPACMRMARTLRGEGLRTDVDLAGRSLKAAMRYASAMGIPHVAIVGEDEVAKGVLTVKRLADGLQSEVPLAGVRALIAGAGDRERNEVTDR